MKESLESNDPRVNIEAGLNWFEQTARKIPGFKGYLELRDRREADQLLRESIAAKLDQTRLLFSSVHESLAGDIIKAIDFAEPLGRIDNRLMGLIGKIKDAPQGYSGFFDAAKVDGEVLDRLYSFDFAMLAHAESIAANVDLLKVAVNNDANIMDAVKKLDESVKDANASFATRNEIITNMS